MVIYSMIGSGAFATACISFTIDAFQRSHRPFNLIGCLLIDTAYCLVLVDKYKETKTLNLKPKT
jgi:hypothetical protein